MIVAFCAHGGTHVKTNSYFPHVCYVNFITIPVCEGRDGLSTDECIKRAQRFVFVPTVCNESAPTAQTCYVNSLKIHLFIYTYWPVY